MTDKKGTYWIDKLKDLFKEEKIDEEDDSWYQNTGSQVDTEQFGNFSDEDGSRSNSQDGEEISFLAKDRNQQKDMNRQIYMKIADAFMHEDSTLIEKEEDSYFEDEGVVQLQKQELAKKTAIKEFDAEFIKSRDSLKLKPQLDIVEMNVFDRIALYQDHSIWQKIYKRCWYIKSMITAIALKIVKSRPFEIASLCVIAVNSVMLALDDPTTNNDNNATTDLVLLIIYTVEMCFKIVALGFIMDQTSYMRDYWNIVDIVIIGTGYLPYIVSGSSFNLSALRSLRVLRPLKSITKIKALKQLLTALFSAIPLLKDSIIILMFFFIIFGIAGLQLFTGQLKSRCIDPETGIMTGDDNYLAVVCAADTDCSGYSNPNGLSYICAKSMVSPISDTIQFDTFGWSVLNVYEIVSLEGWTKIMNLMQDGFNTFSVLYFFIAVYIGAFFLLNLTMAIIGVKYSEAINDQKEKVAAVAEEPGYDMKQLIEWGLYKSNKVYYQELEEDKKIKRSLFGFSFLSLSRNMKSSEKLKKNQSSETPPERAALLPPPLVAVGSGVDPNGLKKVESQQLVFPSPIPLLNNPSGIQTNVNLNNPQGTIAPLAFSSAIEGKKIPNSPNDSSPVGKKRGQDKLISKIETPAPDNPKQAQAPSFKNNAAFGSSLRSLRGGNLVGKTKILSKRIMKIENGQLKKLPLAPKKQSPKNSDLSPTRNANSSDHFPGSQIANQTEENPEPNSAEDKQSKSPRSSQHNSTNLILPHVLVGQLEQINKKNNQGVVLSRDKSGNTGSRPRQRDASKTQDQDSPAGIQVGDGDRKVNLVPLQNKAVNQLRQTQNVGRSTQHHGTKKISGILSNGKQLSRQTQLNNASGSVSPGGTYYQQNNEDNENGVCVLGQNYLNPSGGFQLGVRKSVLGSTEIMNAVGRRGSRKNARRGGENTHIIHQTIVGATQINQTHVQNIQNDDWMNDDFLKEIEAKEKATKKAAAANNGDKSPVDSETHLSIGGDVQIEENYFSNSMPINMLKQQKDPILITQMKPKQANNRDSSVHPLQKKESLEAGDCITSPRKKHGHDRNGSNSGRGLSSKRIRAGNQSNSAYHSNSKTKTITQFDQFSEESDISINRPAGADPINSPSGGDKSPIHNNQKDASILFNDGEFLEIFGGRRKEQMKIVPLKVKKEKKQFKHKTTLREQKSSFNEFKRQESRNITKVVNNYGKEDDKFDIKKEEILLLLENAHLKARVLYDQPYDYVDDVQPMKRKQIKEKKRLEQHNKLKKLRFVIDYSNQKGGKNKKSKTFANIDKSRTFPVRRSDVIDYLLNDNNPFNVLGNENLDPILKEDGISKKISQAGEKIGSQPNYDGQSFTNPHFNKLTVNLEPSIKEISSLQNIEKDLENNEQINNNNLGHRGELPSGRKININHIDSKLGSEDNQASIQDLNAAIVGKDGVSLAKSGTENKIIEMEVDAGLKNLKRLGTQGGMSVPGSAMNNASSMHQLRASNENSGTISRNRVGISSMKNSSRAAATEKGGKQKKKGDAEVKFTFNLALNRIFSDGEVHDVHQQAKKVEEFDFVFAGDVSNKESKMTLTTMKTKDSRMSDGSDSVSKLNSMGMSSNNSLSRDSENFPNSVNHSQKEEDGKAKIDEAFANEPVENKFMKIRKNEIHNLERKGINKVNTEWSASAILPISLYQKSQKSLDRMLTTINHTKYDPEQNEGGIIGIIQAFRRRVKYCVQSSIFDNSIMLCVILNTVILSLDGLVNSTEGQDLMSQFNTIFTIIFAIDMGLKITGYGLSEYVADRMNIFDAFIVSLSLFEMIFLTGSGSSFSAFRAIRILRVFRVLRVTRLIRSLQFMKLMITALGSAISQFIYILLLLFLFMFIYTLLGMSVFGGNLNVPNPPTKMIFDDFFSAAFSVLDLLTVENWNDLKTLCIRSNDVNNYISVAYLISWIFIGNYVFMNLVLAIIMDSFDSDEVKEDKKDIENQFEIVADLDLNHQSIGTTFLGQTTSLNMGSTFNQSNQSGGLNRSQTSLSKGIVGSGSNLKNSQQQMQSPGQQNDSLSQRSSTKRESDLQEKDKINKIEEEEEDGDGDDDKKKTKGKQFVYFDGVYCQKSFYILSQKNIFRKVLYRFYKNPIFEQSVFVAIMLSSLKLTIDTYVSDETSLIYTVGNKVDIVFTAFFATESVVKMVSLGLVMDKASYLRDEWSQLDFFIVICSLIDVSVTSIDLSVIKIFRLLRTLRPLRLLNHNKSMKLIVTALMESVGGISNMIIVVILIWLMFGILGLNLMKDKLSYCDFNSTTNYDIYTYHQTECAYIPGATWSTYDINCDNIGNAMLFLFILSSFEGWPAYVYNFIDASDIGPIHASSSYFAVFFAVFIFVGSFFSINLFSAIMAFNFDIASKKAKNEFLTDQQSQWIELQRLIIQSTPDFASMRQPTNRFRFILWKIVTSQKLEVFIIMCIMANIVTMAMAYDTSPSSYDQMLQNLNYGFTGVFILECILKIIAFGPGGYFFSSWNKFDFFVVIASIVDIITTQIGQQLLSFMKAGPQLIRVMRVLRVSRLLKLIKSFQNLQKLIQTTIFALPSLLNATALFLLFYFIFSILSCYLFSHVTTGNIVNHLNNFDNFHQAFIILFRCSTGEDWMTIMFDVVRLTNPYSIIFFLFFIVTQSYIMMNLFVLIIMNEFEENYIDPDNPLQNFREQEESFKSLWVIMTQKDFGIKIHERFLTDFYFALPEPLGYDYETRRKQFTENLKLHNRSINDEEIQIKCDKFKVKQKQEADKHIMQMNIYCDYEGYIYFNELFFFFFKFSLEEKLSEVDPNRTPQKNFTALSIVRKEEVISLKKINFLKKKQSQLMKQKVTHKRKEGVNPMVRKLFVSMCFSSWLSYSKNTQNKINEMNFNNEDISSESDTDSDAEGEHDKSDLFKAEEEEGIQFRLPNGKKAIIQREHTIFQRIKGLKDREADNLIEHDKYLFLPNTEIYKDDFIQMGEGANYYSQRVFSTQIDPLALKNIAPPDKVSTPAHNNTNARDQRNGSIVVIGGSNIPSRIIQAEQQLLVGSNSLSPSNQRGSFKANIMLSSSKNTNNPNESPSSPDELSFLNGKENEVDKSKNVSHQGSNGFSHSDSKNSKVNSQHNNDKENNENANGVYHNLEETNTIHINRKSDFQP